MKRRELIKLVTLATGAVLSVPLSSSLLTACKEVKPVKDSDYKLLFFKDQQFSFVMDLLEVILPKTDSPSAIDVGVHQIIDTMIGTVYSPEQQKTFSDMFVALTKYTERGNLSDKVQNLLKSEEEKNELAKEALLDMKQQAVAYYLSTEEIAINHLNYLPIPGVYEPCISVESVGGKIWAL